jgi:hypothetical protein
MCYERKKRRKTLSSSSSVSSELRAFHEPSLSILFKRSNIIIIINSKGKFRLICVSHSNPFNARKQHTKQKQKQKREKHIIAKHKEREKDRENKTNAE